jgi:hypothetical protein
MSDNDDLPPRRRLSFPTTNWSDLRKVDCDAMASTIGLLCERYWFPVYAFIRRRWAGPHRWIWIEDGVPVPH